MSEPYPKTRKRMLSIKDVPGILEKGWGGVLSIPLRIEGELGQAIVQCGLGIHDRSTDDGNVQIIETMVHVSKEQTITLSQNDMEKIQQELDLPKRPEAEEKWRVYVESVWGCLRGFCGATLLRK